MRQLFRQGAHAAATAALFLTLGMAQSHAGRFLDDRDFEEALAMNRAAPAGPGNPYAQDRPPVTRTAAPGDPVVSGDGSPESYENAMRENARVLTEALEP